MVDIKEESNMESECHIIRLRGLPWNASKVDIIEFFKDCEIEGEEAGVRLMTNQQGRPSGEAYVHLASADDMAKAMEKNHKHMGKRYIEIFKTTPNEIDWAMNRSQGSHDGDAVVRLRGLPFEATKEEVAHFFSGLEIKPKGITFVKNFDDRRDGGKFDQKGRHSGSAFVQFKSPEIAEQALKKDRCYMGPRYVEVFKSSEGELEQVMTQQQRMQGIRPFPNRPGPYDRMDHMRMGPGMMRSGRGRMGMKPYRDFPDNGFYDEDYDSYDSYGMGDGYSMGSRRGGYGSGMGMMNRNGGFGNQARMGGMSRSGSSGGSSGGGSGSANRGSPGWHYQSCTGHHCHMRGLPFTATEKDIREFFSGLHPVHVEIHLKPNRQATGEADVDFSCHEDAKIAYKRDRQMMGDRYIELFLHSTPGNDFSGGSMESDSCMMGSGGGGYGSSMGGGNGYGQSGNFFGSGMSGSSGMGGMGSGRMGGYGGSGSGMGMGGNNYTPFS